MDGFIHYSLNGLLMEIVWSLMEEGVLAGCITQNKWITSLGSFLGEAPSLKSLTSSKAEAKVELYGQKKYCRRQSASGGG